MNLQTSRKFHLDGIHCALTIEEPAVGVVVLKIRGTDIGEFGSRPMQALMDYLGDKDPVRLFIDARQVRGASISVSGEWAAWLRNQKANLQDISMLTGSRYVEVTAGFVRRFAELESIMRIYTESAAFDDALAQALVPQIERLQ